MWKHKGNTSVCQSLGDMSSCSYSPPYEQAWKMPAFFLACYLRIACKYLDHIHAVYSDSSKIQALHDPVNYVLKKQKNKTKQKKPTHQVQFVLLIYSWMYSFQHSSISMAQRSWAVNPAPHPLNSVIYLHGMLGREYHKHCVHICHYQAGQCSVRKGPGSALLKWPRP